MPRGGSPASANPPSASVDGRELVRLDLEMSVAAPEPHDCVVIEGDPPLDMYAGIRGGTHGDWATVGTVLNAIGPTLVAAPGLRTVLDLALRG